MNARSQFETSIDPKITLNKTKRFLQVTRSGDFNLDKMRASKHEIEPLLRREEIERIMADYREVNFEGFRLIDIDTLAIYLNDDLPSCKRIAFICQSRIIKSLFNHFENVCNCYGIETQLFATPEPAATWLCNEQQTKLLTPCL